METRIDHPGSVASEPAVSLYALLYDRPLTFAEICEGLPPAFRNDAYHAYRESAEDQAHPVGAADGWEWWVSRQLRSGCNTGRIKVATAPGVSKPLNRAGRDDKVWSAIRENPPRVHRWVRSRHRMLTVWTPEAAGTDARREVRRTRFLNTNEDMMALVEGSRIKDKARLLEHLRNGAFVLDEPPDEPRRPL